MLEYRANFLMWAGFTVVYHATAVVALWVTLRNFPSINGWDFRQTAFMYGLWFLGHALHNTFFFGDRQRPGVHPRGPLRPLPGPAARHALPGDDRAAADLARRTDPLASSTSRSSCRTAASRSTRASSCYVPLVAIGGALIDFGINLAIATASFWFIRIDTLRWVIMSLEQDFSRYPISIYQRGVRVVLAFVLPFAFMNYFPATLLLHKSEDGLEPQPRHRPADAARRLRLPRDRVRVLARRTQSLPGNGELTRRCRSTSRARFSC